MAAQKDGEKSKVKVKVRVNTHGIFSVSTASMVEPVKSEDSEDVGVETELETQDQMPAENSSDVSWPFLCMNILIDETVLLVHAWEEKCLLRRQNEVHFEMCVVISKIPL